MTHKPVVGKFVHMVFNAAMKDIVVKSRFSIVLQPDKIDDTDKIVINRKLQCVRNGVADKEYYKSETWELTHEEAKFIAIELLKRVE